MTIRSWLVLALALICGDSLTADIRRPVPDLATDFRGLEPGKFVQIQHGSTTSSLSISDDSSRANSFNSSSDPRGYRLDRLRRPERQPRRYSGCSAGHPRSCAIRSSTACRAATSVCNTPSNIRFAAPPGTLTNQFFSYLATIGTEIQPTPYQLDYNEQATNVLDVTGPVLDIEAERVERWLEQHANPRRAGYTIYFINWYGRDDFRFHVYTKKDDPDPDTQFNFGGRAVARHHSWGGSSSRAWFYDFSAGPEWNTVNWLVDDKDLDGDGEEDYRMPPIWEYSAAGYRPAGSAGPRHGAADAVRRDQPALHDLAALRSDHHGTRSAGTENRGHDDVRRRSRE